VIYSIATIKKGEAMERQEAEGPGKLYLVSTPIGNLEDIAPRAARTLGEVHTIAAEDTRRTRKLLSHLGIRNRITSFNDFNKERKWPQLVGTLQEGKDLALVSDAGTPGISDPGYFLVNRAIDAGIEIMPIPGAAAFLAALVVSGLPTDRFVFEGFLPSKKGKRKARLRALVDEERTILFYESPHRLLNTLRDILVEFGERPVSLSREITKKHEQTLRGRLSEIIKTCEVSKPRGEFVIAVGGTGRRSFRVSSASSGG
jgi:16S rRNA (cytidine1402-2'-O)-methyltransferase